MIGEVKVFHQKEILKVDYNHTCLAVISLNSGFCSEKR